MFLSLQMTDHVFLAVLAFNLLVGKELNFSLAHKQFVVQLEQKHTELAVHK